MFFTLGVQVVEFGPYLHCNFYQPFGQKLVLPLMIPLMIQPLNHSDLTPFFHDNKILLCDGGGGDMELNANS